MTLAPDEESNPLASQSGPEAPTLTPARPPKLPKTTLAMLRRAALMDWVSVEFPFIGRQEEDTWAGAQAEWNANAFVRHVWSTQFNRGPPGFCVIRLGFRLEEGTRCIEYVFWPETHGTPTIRDIAVWHYVVKLVGTRLSHIERYEYQRLAELLEGSPMPNPMGPGSPPMFRRAYTDAMNRIGVDPQFRKGRW